MTENLKIIDLPPDQWARAAKCAAKTIAAGKDSENHPPKYWRDPTIRVINWEGDVIARPVEPSGDAA
ncbi:hypothetical protein J2855_001759 [Agrobacterium tumefaciens]|uniref:hypothetical protein n=1 Tax=Agrobacterium tumefaciens TaxID=358 RepID=UPI000DD4A90D|nr:hypothetical protein [Agrobacterium tumefaciens]MBP2508124.1 hypothetical protein [Agrobacterium tumefaciens]MBP2517276.1 hypothetical protein [Agrobacterium tumefaciens]MBP2575910.1 hypothetical protein [Agrobacterium tumefaciens]MBP2594266.1 hypothetical protein [Agrobacterium tumefaciens]